MNEFEAILETCVNQPEPVVLATVIGVKGSTYRGLGARAVFARDRWLAGMISGGCVEVDLLQTAWERTETGPAVATFDATSEDDVIFGYGLGCAGAIDVLLERPRPGDQTLSHMLRFHASGHPCNVVTEIEPGPLLGARTVSESTGFAPRAQIVSREGRAALVENIQPPLRLLVFGAGNDALPLATLAKEVGWHVTVVDHRVAFASPERFPSVDRVLVAAPGELSALLTDRTYVIVMTHNYLHDLEILTAVVPSDVPYIGLLGPRKRTEKLISTLGGKPDLRIHGPVGLDIGADGPNEIALSILSQVLSVSKGRPA